MPATCEQRMPRGGFSMCRAMTGLVFVALLGCATAYLNVGEWDTVNTQSTQLFPDCVSLHTMVNIEVAQYYYFGVCDFEFQGYNLLVVFGGFTFQLGFEDGYSIGSGTLAYSNQLAIFDVSVQQWQIKKFNATEIAPSARGGHASVVLSPTPAGESFMVLFGGNNGTSVFNDAWSLSGNINLLDLNASLVWLPMNTSATKPPPRWGHAQWANGNSSIVVFGGFANPLNDLSVGATGNYTDALVTWDDLWMLQFSDLHHYRAQGNWQQLRCSSPRKPAGRGGMQYSAVGSMLVMISGFNGQGPDSLEDVWVLNVTSDGHCKWMSVSATFKIFGRVFSTQVSMTVFPNNSVTYPYPYAGFAASTTVANDTMIAYGGVRYAESFFNNALLNSDANTVMFVWTFSPDYTTVSCFTFYSAIKVLLGSSPFGTLGGALAVLDSHIALFGGFNAFASVCVHGLWLTSSVSSLSSGVWSSNVMPNAPTPVFQSSITFINVSGSATGAWFLFGGQTQLYDLSPYFWMFSNGLWQTVLMPSRTLFQSNLAYIKNLSYPGTRWGHTSVSVNNATAMVMFGGLAATPKGLPYSLNELWSWTPSNAPGNRWHNLTSAGPIGRSLHTAVSYTLDNSMLVFGGQLDNNSVLGDFWSWSQDAGWRQISSSGPPPRFGHTAVLITLSSGDYVMVVYGGGNATSFLDDSWCFNMRTQAWSSSPSGPAPRLFSSMIAIGQSKTLFAMFGGLGGSQNAPQALSDMWIGAVNIAADGALQVQYYPFKTSPFGGIYSHTMYILNASQGVLSLYALGGLTNTDFSQQLYTVRLGCLPGTWSKEGFPLQLCAPCILGRFSTTGGNETSGDCNGVCPGSSTTAAVGSSSANNCTVCPPEVCHNHGDCELVLNAGGTPIGTACVCTGFYHWSDNQCKTAYAGILMGALLGSLAVVVLALWIRYNWRRLISVHYEERLLRETLLERKTQELQEASMELEAMERVWVIDPSNIVVESKPFAAGGCGEIYRARYYDRDVVLKKLLLPWTFDTTSLQDFEEEAKLLRKYRHKNIVFFYGAGFDGSNRFIVTEYMARGSLNEILYSKQELPIYMRIKFLADCASGMAYLHGQSPPVVHRDLKAANLLVSDSWVVKVTDFGTARLAGDRKVTEVQNARPAHSIDDTGPSGTLLWMAPEDVGRRWMCTGEVLCCCGADCGSFAIVMVEVLIRADPYEHTSLKAAYFDVREQVGVLGVRPQIPTAIAESFPSAFMFLMTQCWHAQPSCRPQFSGIEQRLLTILAEHSKPEQRLVALLGDYGSEPSETGSQRGSRMSAW